MHVLYVATDVRDADVLSQEVRRVAPSLSMEICAGLSELRARADQATPPDVLLMDCGLSEAEQLQLIHYARVRQLGVPIVGVMGANAAMPSGALSAGLDDLVVRGPKFGERLAPSLRLLTERYAKISSTLKDNEKLKKSEARLRLIIEALPTGVVLIDQGGKVLAMNAAGVALFGGVGPTEIVGRTFATLLQVEDQPGFQEFLKKAGGGEEASLNFSGLVHDDNEAPPIFQLRGLCIQRDDQGQTAVLGVLDHVKAASSTQHTWTDEFNLDVTGLTPPMLDMPGIESAALEAAESRAHELAGRCQIAEARIEELEQEMHRARATAQQAAQQAEQRAAALKEQAAQAAAKAAETGNQLAQTTGQLAKAQEQYASQALELGTLRQSLKHEQEQRAASEAQRAAAEAQAAEARKHAQAQAETHAQSHAQTHAQAQQAQQAAAETAANLARQQESIARITGELESARQEVHALRDTLARERDTHNQSLAQVHAETRAQIEAQSQVHAQGQAQLQALLSQAQGRATEAETLRAELDTMRAEMGGLSDQLGAARAANELQSSAAQTSAAQQNAQASELQIVRDELASARAMLAAQREAHDQLQASLVRKDAHVADLEHRARMRVTELEQEHRVAVERLQQLLEQALKDSQASTASSRGAGADGAKRGAERVGRLAAAMAVDLNGAAEAAAETSRAVLAVLPQGAPGRDHAEKTLETVQRCAELARHLLRMSTRYMGQSSRIDVSALVRQQEALLQHLAGPDIELQFDLTGGLSSSELDAQEVTQVLTSLTVTARDALPLGGAIRITTTSQRQDPADAAPRTEPLRPLVLAVTARGYGIRPVSSSTCEDVTARCGGLLTTVIEPNVSWTLMAMLPGGLAQELEAAHADLSRSA
jgi:PAS domain-containing protein